MACGTDGSNNSDARSTGNKLFHVASYVLTAILGFGLGSGLGGWLGYRIKEKKCKESIETEVLGRQEERDKKYWEKKDDILEEEEKNTNKILSDIDELRPLLIKRQDLFCDRLVPRRERQAIEDKLLSMTYNKSYEQSLGLHSGMLDILKNDGSCSGPRKGHLMWVYMEFWKAQAELLKHRNVAWKMRAADRAFNFSPEK